MKYTFESAMARLEEISRILSENNVTLDESLNLYAEGVKLLNFCNDKLNKARKNIDVSNLATRLRVDVGENNGKPFVTFTRFDLKPNVIVPKSFDDYKPPKTFVYQSNKKCDMLKYALDRIIKLGNNAPRNKMYQSVVMNKM